MRLALPRRFGHRRRQLNCYLGWSSGRPRGVSYWGSGMRPLREEPVPIILCLVFATSVIVAILAVTSRDAVAQDSQIKRGKYLVTLGGCNDCHTPGYFFGKPDLARFL